MDRTVMEKVRLCSRDSRKIMIVTRMTMICVRWTNMNVSLVILFGWNWSFSKTLISIEIGFLWKTKYTLHFISNNIKPWSIQVSQYQNINMKCNGSNWAYINSVYWDFSYFSLRRLIIFNLQHGARALASYWSRSYPNLSHRVYQPCKEL